ncbi:MAG TPA: hypothetical protein VGG38_04945 [Acidimicrobiales bacterium]
MATVVAVAAAAVLLVTLVPVQLGRDGSQAAAALNDLATAAGRQPSLGPGQYEYTEVELEPTGSDASGAAGVPGGWTSFSVGTVQTWIAANGAGKQVTSSDLNPDFMTATDKANWAKAGGKFVEPPNYVVTDQQFGAGGKGLSSNQFQGSRPVPFDVAALPTDPTRLAATLCASKKWKALPTADATVVGYSIQARPSGCQLFGIAVTLLQGPDLGSTPALRQALFKVLAGVSGVRLLGTRTDAAGKRGVELQLVDRTPAGVTKVSCTSGDSPTDKVVKRYLLHHPAMSTIFTVIVDPSTGVLLSLERSFTPAKLSVDSLVACMRPPGGNQLEEQLPDRSVLLSSGVVSSINAVAKGTVEECAAGSVPTFPWYQCNGARKDGDRQ